MKNPNELPDLKKKYMKNILKIIRTSLIAAQFLGHDGMAIGYRNAVTSLITGPNSGIRGFAATATNGIGQKISFYCQFCFQDYSFFIERLN
jgi:hypothetical protein